MKISDFILKEKTRGDCYRFLSACFYQPQKELFLQEKLFENLTAALKEICPDAVISSDRMKSAVLNCSDEELSVEYARLFMGPFELVAPPYGSVYLDGARQVMGDSTVETMKMYEAAGLSMDNEFKELPDHITVELEFMNFLIYKEIEAIEKSDFSTALDFIKTQELFLDKFLKRWVKLFCDKIKEGTDNEFYTSLADCVSIFIGNARPGDDIPEELSAKAVQR